MRGTVKQGRGGVVSRSGSAGQSKSGGGRSGGGGRRSKANAARLTAINPGVTVGPVVTGGPPAQMVIKQEPGLDLKPDPDACPAAQVNGVEDSFKSIMAGDLAASKGLSMIPCHADIKIKNEMMNGSMGEGLKCATDASFGPLVAPGMQGPTASQAESPPTQKIEGGGNCAVGGSLKPGSGTAGVATSEAQYMQQQSQIFVFTTQLANKAADAVMGGAFLSIIDFHCSQPATKKLLEKHPLKMNQFSRQTAGQWLNAGAATKTSKAAVKCPAAPQCPASEMNQVPGMGCVPPTGNGSMPGQMLNNCMMPEYMNCGGPPMGPNGPGGPQMMGPNPNGSPGMMAPTAGPGMMGPRGPSMMMHPGSGPAINPNMCGPGPQMTPMSAQSNPRLQGVIVPDEHLTPEQRQHRVEQMARLRQMQALLLPELQGGSKGPAESSPAAAVSSPNQLSQSAASGLSGGAPSPPASQTLQNRARDGAALSHSAGLDAAASCLETVNTASSASLDDDCPPGGDADLLKAPPCSGPGPGMSVVSSPSLLTPPAATSAGPGPALSSSAPPPNSASTPTSTSFSLSGSSPPCAPCTASATAGCAVSSYSSAQMSAATNNGVGPSPLPPPVNPSPGMGSSPTLGPSPVMGASPIMGQGGPAGMMPSQPGPGMMGNMMMPGQGQMMGPGPPMRFVGPGGPMMMDPTSNPSMAAQMDWQRMQVEFFQSKRKKGGAPGVPMGPDGQVNMMGPNCHMGPNGPMGSIPMGPNGPMGNPMMGNMCANMGMVPGPNMRPFGPNVNNRLQGPPPPYHGPRPMVDGAVPSPGSPILPNELSPRMTACGPVQMRMPCVPGPGPPNNSAVGPGSAVPSPAAEQPQSLGSEMPFGRQLQCFAQQKHQQAALSSGPESGAKEPSLMPVPSPQQIQYLNAFDGQELTIQKQPNNSVREADILSPMNSAIESSNSNMDSQGSNCNKVAGPSTPQGGPSTPHTPSDAARYAGAKTPDRFPAPSPGMAPPLTPQQTQSDPKSTPAPSQQRFGAPSPLSNSGSANASLNSSSGGPKTPSSGFDSRFAPVPSPKTPGGGMCSAPGTPVGDLNNPRFPGASPLQAGAEMGSRFPGSNCSTPGGPATSAAPQNGLKQQMTVAGYAMSPGKMPDLTPVEFNSANLPLNPNCSAANPVPNAAPGKMFDPISSMAQMSQQLTSAGPDNSPIAAAPNLVPGGPMPMCGPPNIVDNNHAQMMGIAPVSSSPTLMSGPIASPSGPRGPSPGAINMMGSGPAQRMAGPGIRPMGSNSPVQGNFVGANVQVKPNAPNTIQYLPNRPQPNMMGPCPRGPTNMDYIQRHNAPLPVEKVGSPMFPNCSSTPNPICTSNVPLSTLPSMSMSGPCGPAMNVPGSPMCSLPGAMPGAPSGPGGNMAFSGPGGPVGPPNGPMAMGPAGPMGGPMMGPGGPMMPMNGPIPMNPNMMMAGPMGPNGQMMGSRGGVSMMRGPSPVPMMGPVGGDMYAIPGGHPGPNPGAPQSQMMPSTGSMYAGPKGGGPPVVGGPMPGSHDTAQPLPPSMGQSGNFKNSAMMAPSPNDPAYAVQFHNFQQQLYATNTRGPMGPMGVPMGPHPGMPMGQGPAGPMMPQNFPYTK